METKKKIILSAAFLAAVVSAYAQGNGQAGITEATNKEIMGRFTKYFVTDLSSSNRLLLASSVDSVNPELKNPKNLLQSLFLDNTRELDLKQAFKDAFNMEITLDYSSMLKLCFRVAKIMPDIPEDPRKAYPIRTRRRI